MDRIDFRSDTVSWPTPQMREAMATATVGDDVYGEDPTVLELEATAAEMMGKEAAVFVSSGTMGNLVAILSHTTRGDEAIMGEDSHTYCSEAGGMATLGGVMPRPLPTDPCGRMNVAQIEDTISPDNPHYAKTSLILVENSYGQKYGYPIEPDYFADVREVASRHGLAVHMDGARVFNAAVALEVDVKEIVQHVDSVTFCLSKALSAPVGSILCGSDAFIHRARRNRKVLGGGTRQAGVLAAAGLVSLNTMVGRLAEDHRRAKMLADGLAKIPCIRVEPDRVRTNMVFFDLDDRAPLHAQKIADQLQRDANIWIRAMYGGRFRAVMHHWIEDQHVALLLSHLEQLLQTR